MGQREIVLAGLSPAGCAHYTPVQVQKLFFLIDREVSSEISGPQFQFEPYNYGPFDPAVCHVLDSLTEEGLVEKGQQYKWQTYGLTPAGRQEGEQILKSLSPAAQNFMARASAFVRKLSFTELVSAIYKAYPEMRANSVFQG